MGGTLRNRVLNDAAMEHWDRPRGNRAAKLNRSRDCRFNGVITESRPACHRGEDETRVKIHVRAASGKLGPLVVPVVLCTL